MSPPPSGRALLVVVSCGTAKIWDKHPDAGPTPAAKAYTGPPFTVNRDYAEQAGGDWMVLSAKYGFLHPADLVAGPYNKTFTRRSTNPIGFEVLRQQVRQLDLDHYATVVGLGGKDYRAAVEAAFDGTSVALQFPFSGLRVGKAMAATKRATGQ